MKRLCAVLCALLLTSGCVITIVDPVKHTALPKTCFENQQAQLREIAGPLADRKVEYKGRTTSTDLATPPGVELDSTTGSASCEVRFEAGERVGPGSPRRREVQVSYNLAGSVNGARNELHYDSQNRKDLQPVAGLGDEAVSSVEEVPDLRVTVRVAFRDSNLVVKVSVTGDDAKPDGGYLWSPLPRAPALANALLIARAEASR